jgi:predicted  nucleic acid-binding Zn-ribbon protein
MRAAKEKDTPVKIKPEVKPKPEKSGKRQHSEVVDLLSDDDEEEVSITSVVNTKRVKTAGSSSVEVLDLTGEQAYVLAIRGTEHKQFTLQGWHPMVSSPERKMVAGQ